MVVTFHHRIELAKWRGSQDYEIEADVSPRNEVRVLRVTVLATGRRGRLTRDRIAAVEERARRVAEREAS